MTFDELVDSYVSKAILREEIKIMHKDGYVFISSTTRISVSALFQSKGISTKYPIGPDSNLYANIQEYIKYKKNLGDDKDDLAGSFSMFGSTFVKFLLNEGASPTNSGCNHKGYLMPSRNRDKKETHWCSYCGEYTNGQKN